MFNSTRQEVDFRSRWRVGWGSSHFAVENILNWVKREGGMYVLLLLIIIQIIFLWSPAQGLLNKNCRFRETKAGECLITRQVRRFWFGFFSPSLDSSVSQYSLVRRTLLYKPQQNCTAARNTHTTHSHSLPPTRHSRPPNPSSISILPSNKGSWWQGGGKTKQSQCLLKINGQFNNLCLFVFV